LQAGFLAIFGVKSQMDSSLSLQAKRSNPVRETNLDCFVATLLAMTRFGI
jgi:hypothetical protein